MSVPVSLEQVLAGLGESFHSIDVRAAVAKQPSGQLQTLLLGLRISARSVEMIKERYAELETRFGRGSTENFHILLEALPFHEMSRISGEIERGQVTLAGQEIVLSRGVRIQEFKGSIGRHNWSLRPWTGEDQASGFYCSTGVRSLLYGSLELAHEIQSTLGVDIDQMVDAFLEKVRDAGQALELFVQVEMPVRLERINAVSWTVTVDVAVEKNLRGVHLLLMNRGSGGLDLLQKREVPLQPTGRDEMFTRFRGMIELAQPAKEEEWVTCVLNHERVGVLDEVQRRLRESRPLEEKNPLRACLSQFWDLKTTIYRHLEPPSGVQQGMVPPQDGRTSQNGDAQRRGEREPKTGANAPEREYQKAVSRLLTLAGFQAIDLERQDKLYQPGTKVQAGTADILAYHQAAKLLIVGECTINAPKRDDYDKVLNAGKVLRGRLFVPESPVRIIPILFCWQESEPEWSKATDTRGMVLMPTLKLRALTHLIECGDQEQFIDALKFGWPIPS